jgi:hypothetical protein
LETLEKFEDPVTDSGSGALCLAMKVRALAKSPGRINIGKPNRIPGKRLFGILEILLNILQNQGALG